MAHFDLVMSTKEQRIEELKRFGRAIGVDLDRGAGALQSFNDWFAGNVEPDPDRPGRARGRWLSVCHDLALYIGDSWIADYPHLHWTLHTGGRRNVSYQRPVIAGFPDAPRYTVDLDYALGGYAGDVARGAARDDNFFTQLVRSANEEQRQRSLASAACLASTTMSVRWWRTAPVRRDRSDRSDIDLTAQEQKGTRLTSPGRAFGNVP